MNDALMENLDYLKVTDCKNISDTLFKRFRDLIVMGKLPAGILFSALPPAGNRPDGQSDTQNNPSRLQ